MTAPPTEYAPRTARNRWLLAAVLIAIPILALHGRSLGYGLFMDDYPHYVQLREAGWSLGELTEACRLELNGGIAEVWWLPQFTLRFFRPVSFGLMKLTYTLSGWDPLGAHIASLAWHFAACLLLFALLRRLGTLYWLAVAGAAAYAIHPGHLATIQWVACQSELIVTTLLLGATLCLGRYCRWPGFAAGERNGLEWPWALAAAVLFALALGCRENAVMFPLVTALVAWRFGTQRRGRVIAIFAVLGVLLVGMLATRTALLGGVSLPPRPYVVPPGAPDFLRFVFDKAWYYLLGIALAFPVVPIGGLPYLRTQPVVFYGLAALVLAIVVVFFIRRRDQVSGWLAPAWLFGFLAPLLPVFEAPHHLYLPGIGWIIMAVALLQDLIRVRPEAPQTTRWVRRSIAGVVMAVSGSAFILGTHLYGLAIDTGQQVEDCIIQEVITDAEDLNDGDTLYMANLPLLGHYVRIGIELQSGRDHLRVVPLTWSPRLLGTTAPTEIEWIDERTIEMRVVDDRYFAGPLGRLVHDANGGPLPDEIDRTEDLGFRVAILERDDEGLQRLRFTFTRPLSADDVHLFWGSRVRWAQPLEPEPPHESE
jgi:hypothetical protein